MTVRNLNLMFQPASVALIGASGRAGSVGNAVSRNLLEGGFRGDTWLVNPRRSEVLGQKTYRSIDALPAAPDLAVIATPPAAVQDVISDLAEKGCRAAVVITAGFGEGDDADGRRRAQAVLDTAKPHLMRILGPNCVGLILPSLGLNASFAPGQVLPGRLAFISQSGAVITAVADWATDRGIGFSHMISMGGMLDVDLGDVLDYLAQERETSAVLLYAEAVTSARKFMSAARALARAKPVIVMKSGRHPEGAKAAASHTGALAGSDQVYDAAFSRAGFVRVRSMDEMFAAVETLAMARRPRANRLCILSNGGGAGVLATDSLIDYGGSLSRLAPETVARLDAVLPETWSGANPVDIIGDAGPERYAAALDAVASDPDVGAILALNAPTGLASSSDAARAVAEWATAQPSAPLLTSCLGGEKARRARDIFTAARVPTYDTPDDAVRAFTHLVEYYRRREALMQTPPAAANGPPPDRVAASRVIAGVRADGRTMLTEPEAKAVLAAYHIPVARTETADDAAAAAARAGSFDGPYALKILSRDISHKTDVGGVVLNLPDAAAVGEAAKTMAARLRETAPDARLDGFTVQEMVSRPRAHELIVGLARHAPFGPVLLVGQGGTAAEAIADTSMALPPLNPLLAEEALRRIRLWRLLRGYRDRPAADIAAICGTMIRVGELAADMADIAELDINPLLADDAGVIALDARILLTDAPAQEEERAHRFAIRPYPTELQKTLDIDGSPYYLRPVRPEDEAALVTAFNELSPDEVRLRFFSVIKSLRHDMAARLTQIDYDREMALVLFQGEDDTGVALGIARFSADPDFDTAEFAITVRSGAHGRGYGRALMEQLIAYAGSRGIGEMFGVVLADNRPMLALARSLGFSQTTDLSEPGVVRVSLRLRGRATASGQDAAMSSA